MRRSWNFVRWFGIRFTNYGQNLKVLKVFQNELWYSKICPRLTQCHFWGYFCGSSSKYWCNTYGRGIVRKTLDVPNGHMSKGPNKFINFEFIWLFNKNLLMLAILLSTIIMKPIPLKEPQKELWKQCPQLSQKTCNFVFWFYKSTNDCRYQPHTCFF